MRNSVDRNCCFPLYMIRRASSSVHNSFEARSVFPLTDMITLTRNMAIQRVGPAHRPGDREDPIHNWGAVTYSPSQQRSSFHAIRGDMDICPTWSRHNGPLTPLTSLSPRRGSVQRPATTDHREVICDASLRRLFCRVPRSSQFSLQVSPALSALHGPGLAASWPWSGLEHRSWRHLQFGLAHRRSTKHWRRGSSTRACMATSPGLEPI